MSTITGNGRNNSIHGTSSSDWLYGLGGKDNIDGRAGDDNLSGNDGNDNLVGGSGDDSLYGGHGNDKLTGGNDVAVTGTIDVEGNVGAIGGLAQKASAVRQVGAKYFIVPESQSPDSLAAARAVVGDDVEIITVKTLDDALHVLAGLGGNGDDLGTPGKTYTPPS